MVRQAPLEELLRSATRVRVVYGGLTSSHKAKGTETLIDSDDPLMLNWLLESIVINETWAGHVEPYWFISPPADFALELYDRSKKLATLGVWADREGVSISQRTGDSPRDTVLHIVEGQRLLDWLDEHSATEEEKEHAQEICDFVSANTRFSFELFLEVAQRDFGENVFVSPLSVQMALAMAYIGARGETQEAIAETLALRRMSPDDLNHAIAGFRSAMSNLGVRVRLDIANALYGRKGIGFKPEFIHKCQEFYDARVEALDFDDPASAAIINGWVKEKTNGKISRIVDRLDPLDILVLLNAIYFKGTWAYQFDEKDTRPKPFTLLSGKRQHVPMMSISGRYRYYRGKNFQAVGLPYVRKRVSMYVLLPDQDFGLEEFQRSLTAENWDAWMPQFQHIEGHLELPRFKADYDITLNDALKALGMGIAFEGRADFDGIASLREGLFINRVRQRALVEVNEEGTEVVIVTSTLFAASGPQPPTFRMIVNRPFICIIRDDKTGAILFMGAIVEPK